MTFTDAVRILLGSFVGTLGFAYLLHAPRRAMLPASLVGAGAYFLYWALTLTGLSEPFCVFLGTLCGSLAGHLCARRMKMISTIFLTLSIVAIVPGLGLYRTMSLLGSGETTAGAQQGVQAMTSIAMIALGMGVGGFVDRLLHPQHRHGGGA